MRSTQPCKASQAPCRGKAVQEAGGEGGEREEEEKEEEGASGHERSAAGRYQLKMDSGTESEKSVLITSAATLTSR